jgi:hypothetical protein
MSGIKICLKVFPEEHVRLPEVSGTNVLVYGSYSHISLASADLPYFSKTKIAYPYGN